MVVEYVRALMQKKLVCRSAEDRKQLAQQMLQDVQLLRDVFHSLVRISLLIFNQVLTKLMMSCNSALLHFVKVSLQRDKALK